MGEAQRQETIALPPTVPIFPLGGALLLPRTRLPLNIFEPRYLDMVRDALSGNQVIGMVQPRDPANYASERQAEIYPVGCLGRITEHRETSDGRYLIVLEGVSRFRILRELDAPTAYRQLDVSYEEFRDDAEPAANVLQTRDSLIRDLKGFLVQLGAEVDMAEIETTPDEQLVNSLAIMCPFPGIEKQALLEAPTLEERAAVLCTLMALNPTARPDPATTSH